MLIILAILLFLHADCNIASPTRTSFNLDNLWIIVSFIVSFSLPTGWADESYKQTERNNLRIAVIVDQPGIVEADKFWQVAPGKPLVLVLDRGGSKHFRFS